MEKRAWFGAEGLRGDPPSAESLSSSCRQEAWLRATPTGHSQNRQEGTGKQGLLPIHLGHSCPAPLLECLLLLPALRSLGAAPYQILKEPRNPPPSAN